MPKQGEIDYFRNIGTELAQHAVDKPFSDPDCSRYLMDIAAILTLLPQPPAKLLDLGAGTGWTSVFYARRGYDVTGQDIAEDATQLANLNKARYQVDNVRFITCDYEDMAFENEFDCAVFYDSLHHAVDEVAALRMVYKALKPGGVCVTLEPGVGHAEAETSKMVMAQYGVTERDMPPSLIMQSGHKAGFRYFKLYGRPTAITEIAAPAGPVPRSTINREFRETFVQDFLHRDAWNRPRREMQQRFDDAMQRSNLFLMKK